MNTQVLQFNLDIQLCLHLLFQLLHCFLWLIVT